MKRIFYIFILLTGISFSAAAQTKTASIKIIKFYPNPASVGINFEFQSGYDKSYSITILNFMGRKVFEINKPNLRNYVNLSSFYRGAYIFQLRDRNGKIVETNKFQVVK